MARDYNLRSSFNTVAEQYDKYRPSYPKELFEYIANETNINTKSNLLEIGCGTGQATKYFVEK
jgi:ubiquinone/menaquinone biosynthesis C-methylase UbiE